MPEQSIKDGIAQAARRILSESAWQQGDETPQLSICFLAYRLLPRVLPVQRAPPSNVVR